MAYKYNPHIDELDYYEEAGAAANGLPEGGDAGQVLSKVDGTDYNAEWSDAPAGYTDEQAQDAVGNAVGNGLDYDDATGAISVDETELDHGSIGGLDGDDHTQYIHNAPTSSTRNVIQPTDAAYVPFTLKGAASQTANLLNITDSADTVLSYFDKRGSLYIDHNPLTGVTGTIYDIYTDLDTTGNTMTGLTNMGSQIRGIYSKAYERSTITNPVGYGYSYVYGMQFETRSYGTFEGSTSSKITDNLASINGVYGAARNYVTNKMAENVSTETRGFYADISDLSTMNNAGGTLTNNLYSAYIQGTLDCDITAGSTSQGQYGVYATLRQNSNNVASTVNRYGVWIDIASSRVTDPATSYGLYINSVAAGAAKYGIYNKVGNNFFINDVAASPVLTLQGAASQSGDYLIVEDSAGNDGFVVEADFDVVIGSGAAGKDYSLTFNGETNDGVLTWMEDEDYFQFADNVVVPNLYASTKAGVGATAFTYPGAGSLEVVVTNATGNTMSASLDLTRKTSGTPAAGLGTTMSFNAQDSAGNPQQVASFGGYASDVTAGSVDGCAVIRTRKNSGAFVSGLTIDQDQLATFSAGIYVTGDCSALTFTDRTPFYDGNAIEEIKKIKGKGGEIDHKSLPKSAQRNIKTMDGEEIEGRDLGSMISILTKAIQQLTERIEKLEEAV